MMNNLLDIIESLENESDVEQKIIMPLLVNDAGINIVNIATKSNIRKYFIDKGAAQKKLYFPDYIISHDGLPVVVVEAKGPDVELSEGWREARLYAAELNSSFPAKVNPVTYIVACNGSELWYGNYDVAEPTRKINMKTTFYGSEELSAFIECISLKSLGEITSKIRRSLTPSYRRKPRSLVGGQSIQNEELPKNDFVDKIASEIRSIFNPELIEDRSFLVNEGYIESSKNKRSHDDIDSYIKATFVKSDEITVPIENLKNPREIIQQLKVEKNFNGQLMLLIGGVGVGKTTFIDYMQFTRVIVDGVNRKIVWLRFDLNKAPLNKEDIYDWIRENIILELQKHFAQEISDFEELEFLERLYAVEINRYDKSEGRLNKQIGEKEYLVGKAELLKNLLSDKQKTVLAYLRHLISERGNLSIIAFDNCDKQQRDEQLLMFQVAQWAKDNFRSLILLPLRDETYDSYKDQPPLDTAIKDLSFRVDPPNFKDVLHRRIQLSLDRLGRESESKKNVELSNGWTVFCDQSDREQYLLSVFDTILRYDGGIRKLITGLSGNNIRRALEIFLSFCSSSYISNDRMFKMKASSTKQAIPLHVATQALMRSTRRFYDGDSSYIKNLFEVVYGDNGIPKYFLRMIILRWLRAAEKEERWIVVTGRKNYMPISLMISELIPHGFTHNDIINQILYLVKAWCITTEDFRMDNISDSLLIRLSPAGYVHLDLVDNNLTYLATVAEDTTICNESIVTVIKERIVNNDERLGLPTIVKNASDLMGYLKGYESLNCQDQASFLSSNLYEQYTNLDLSISTIENGQESLRDPYWEKLMEKYSADDCFEGTITNIHDKHGFFVKVPDFDITGLVHKRNLPKILDGFNTGSKINVRIANIDPITRKLFLILQ